MKLLIIKEGYGADKPADAFFAEHGIDKVSLLYLSPTVKAYEYKEELRSSIKKDIEIEIINHKKLIDFEYTRTNLLDFIASLPKNLTVKAKGLSQYLTIQGLNMWWSSGIVEATPYKHDILQNLYYLSAVRNILQKNGIGAVWFEVENPALENDLISLFKEAGIKYYHETRSGKSQWIKYSLVRFKSWLLFFSAHFIYALIFKLVCPRWLRIKKARGREKNVHLFYSYYPFSLYFKDGVPKAKIYGELPSFLPKRSGGESYYLCNISPVAILSPWKLMREVGQFWRNKFRFLPMHVFIPFSDILRIFLSPVRYWKYFRLRHLPGYRNAFKINGIDMCHTFDRLMRNSIVGSDAWNNLLHYHAIKNFVNKHRKSISEIIYYVELHSWEAAFISGAKDADRSIPIIGLQQSAPSPILLSFYFSPDTFKDKNDVYPFPDLMLCSGQLYKDLLVSCGIDKERIEVIGHISGQHLMPCPSNELRAQKLKELNFPTGKKICLVVCCVAFAMTEAVIYLLAQVVRKLPDILFAIKGHPDYSIDPLLRKYNIDNLENLRSSQVPIPTLLPLSDYFLSISTSVSPEALCLGIPQVNLDVIGLPQSNPLHLVPGLISDVETSEQLLEFFYHSDEFRIPRDKCCLFMGDLNVNPCDRFINIITEKFPRR